MVSLYRQYDKEGTLLYIGVSKSVMTRLSQHSKFSAWYHQISRVEVEHYETRDMALAAETEAIRQEKPKFNVVHNQPENPLIRHEAEMIGIVRSITIEALYTVSKAASVLGCSESAVRRMIKDREIGSVNFPYHSSKLRITGWQLIEYLEYLENNGVQAASHVEIKNMDPTAEPVSHRKLLQKGR